MKILFTTQAWEDYLYWQVNDKKVLKRINSIIENIRRTPFEGLGKPEALKFGLSGYWSRRINHEHRLVYKIENELLYIAQCRYHY
ncbi:MAG: Txe/YoeB family addiction module toxin [Cyanobacteriota bacterium]